PRPPTAPPPSPARPPVPDDPLERMTRVEAGDAGPEEAPHRAPLTRHQPPEDGQADPRVKLPRDAGGRPGGQAELQRGNPPPRADHPRQLAHRRRGVIDVPQQIRNR